MALFLPPKQLDGLCGDVRARSARDVKFSLTDYYGRNTTNVLVGDGAYLVPDETGRVGKEEFHR